jgi:hypothetical protein
MGKGLLAETLVANMNLEDLLEEKASYLVPHLLYPECCCIFDVSYHKF